jgi:hypothetical protein
VPSLLETVNATLARAAGRGGTPAPPLAKRDPTPPAPTQEIGVTGLWIAAGQVVEPVPSLRDLTGRRGRLLLEEMAREDATVATCVGALLFVLLAVTWRVDPADDSPAAADLAEFLDGVLFQDMSHTWVDFLGDVFTMIRHGFSVFEPVWKRRLGRHPDDPARDSKFNDGRIGLRKLAPRSQLTIYEWQFDDAGGVRGVTQRPVAGEAIPIPIERLVVFRTARDGGNPEGVSLLVPVRRPWAEKRHIASLEVTGIDKDLTGTPIIRAPRSVVEARSNPEADPARAAVNLAKLQGAERLLQGLKGGKVSGLLLSSEPYLDDAARPTATPQWSYDQVGTAGTRTIDPQKASDARKADMMTAFFAQFLLLGSSNRGGNRALSEDQSSFFVQSAGYLLGRAMETINNPLVARVWELNGLPEELRPTVAHDRVTPHDLQVLGAYLQSTGAAGIPWNDPDAINYVRRLIGVAELPEDDPRLQAPEPAPQPAEEGVAAEPGKAPPPPGEAP